MSFKLDGMVNKKRGRPKGKKNSPKFTLIPLSILKMLVRDNELVEVSLDWLSSAQPIKKTQPQVSQVKQPEEKIEYKITEFKQ